MRIYLPLTLPLLAEALRQRSVGPAPLAGHAVTEDLLAELGDVDEEEAEYVALTAAAQASLALLGEDDPPLRVVVALEVPAAEAVGGDDPSAVRVAHEVPWRRLAAVHVDSADAGADVAAARAALGGAGADDAAERCLDHELGWYAVQEVPDLLAGLLEG